MATAIGVLIQAGVLLGFFFAFVKLRGKLETILTNVTEHALPLIARSKEMVEDLSPKLSEISTNLVEVSDLLKQETHTIKTSVDEVVEKTRAQTARVDEMVSGTLDGLSQATATIQQGIEVPLRHIHGVFSGVKAAFETLRDKSANSYANHSVHVEERVVAAEEPVVVVVEEVLVSASKPVV